MRKRVKTITEVTHEYGTISLEADLYETLLDHASHDSVTDKHIDMIVERTVKITEEEDGKIINIFLESSGTILCVLTEIYIIIYTKVYKI